MPSQVELEDAETILSILAIRNYSRAKALIERPDSDDEMLEQAGVSDELASLVMENIRRSNAR